LNFIYRQYCYQLYYSYLFCCFVEIKKIHLNLTIYILNDFNDILILMWGRNWKKMHIIFFIYIFLFRGKKRGSSAMGQEYRLTYGTGVQTDIWDRSTDWHMVKEDRLTYGTGVQTDVWDWDICRLVVVSHSFSGMSYSHVWRPDCEM
jgi:hypothetical protein